MAFTRWFSITSRFDSGEIDPARITRLIGVRRGIREVNSARIMKLRRGEYNVKSARILMLAEYDAEFTTYNYVIMG